MSAKRWVFVAHIYVPFLVGGFMIFSVRNISFPLMRIDCARSLVRDVAKDPA